MDHPIPIPPTQYRWDPARPNAFAEFRESPDEPDIVYVDVNGPWLVNLHWAVIEGRVECVGLHLRHATDSEPVTTSLLRRFNLSGQVVRWRRQLRRDAVANLEEFPSDKFRPYWEGVRAVTQGKPRYESAHFEEVARVYAEAYANGEPPTQAVEEHFGRRLPGQVTHSAAAKWVMKCRERGLLPPTQPRRAYAGPPTTDRNQP